MLNAAEKGRLEEAQRLLRSKEVDATTGYRRGETALLLAANKGHWGVVRWLVQEGGSSVGERDNNGWTTLLWAACNDIWGGCWLVVEGGSRGGE